MKHVRGHACAPYLVGLPLAFALIGCGRLQFEPTISDASGDPADAPIDSPADSLSVGLVVRYRMDTKPNLTGFVMAEPNQYSVACGAPAPPCPSVGQGQVGSGSYIFDGSIRLELGALIDIQPYSVSLWLKPDASATTMTAISKDLGPANSRNEMSFRVDGSAVSYEGADAGGVKNLSVPLDLHMAWHVVTMTWDGSLRVLYVDGTERNRGMGVWLYDNRPIGIGADLDFGSLNLPYRGAMDDLRIYNRALTAPEVFLLSTLRQ